MSGKVVLGVRGAETNREVGGASGGEGRGEINVG